MPFSLRTKIEISVQQGGKPLADKGPPYEYAHIDHDHESPLYDDPSNGYLTSADAHEDGHYDAWVQCMQYAEEARSAGDIATANEWLKEAQKNRNAARLIEARIQGYRSTHPA